MAQAITSLVKYKDVEKLNVRTGVFERFFPLRAVGVGNESGQKLVHKGGLDALSWDGCENCNSVSRQAGRCASTAKRPLAGRRQSTLQG